MLFFGADDATIEIGRQVLQGRLAATDVLDIDDPLRRQRGGDLEAIVNEGGKEARTEDASECLLVEQVLVFDRDPLSPCLLYAAARDDDMQMGVEVARAGMGMQDSGHGEIGAEETGIESEVFQGAGSGVEEQGVDACLMAPGECSELMGQGEGDHEVVDWEELGGLAVKPSTGVMVMALGTTAVATGLRLGHRFSALPAL